MDAVTLLGKVRSAVKDGNIGPALLRQQCDIAKGGVIGTSGKGAVALRFDDDAAGFKTTFLAHLTARKLPAGFALITDMSHVRNAGVTLEDLQDWNYRRGIEFWNHSKTHMTVTNFAELKEEMLYGKQTFAAANIKEQGWMQPGTPSTVYPLAGNNVDYWKNAAGRMIYENFPLSCGWFGTQLRALPTGPMHGAGHVTLTTLSGTGATSSSWMSACLDTLAVCIQRKLGVQFLIHSQDIDLTNTQGATKLTLNDFLTVLDSIVTSRDNGTLDVLTPSGLMYANPYSSDRINLLAGGDFDNLTAGTNDIWSSGSWVGKTFPQTGGIDGGACFEMDNSQTSANSLIYQQFNNVSSIGVDGETFEVYGMVQSTGAGAQKGRILIETDGYKILDSQAGAGTTGHSEFIAQTTWTAFRFSFSIPPGKNFIKFSVGRSGSAAGAGYGLRYDKLAIRKI